MQPYMGLFISNENENEKTMNRDRDWSNRGALSFNL